MEQRQSVTDVELDDHARDLARRLNLTLFIEAVKEALESNRAPLQIRYVSTMTTWNIGRKDRLRWVVNSLAATYQISPEDRDRIFERLDGTGSGDKLGEP